jgi:Flp pilus assembly protein TadD
MALSSEPSNAEILYNLGMALSDGRQLEEAKAHLDKCTTLVPRNARVWLALGVCCFRMQNNNDALSAFESAYQIEPTDPFVLKTLGAFLSDTNGDLAKAKKLLNEALTKMPNDQQLLFNIGQLSEKLDDFDNADHFYLKAIELNPHSDIGEACKLARSKISETLFKRNSHSSNGRPDGFMYCLSALEMFDEMSNEEVTKITFEIATLGMNGLDVNDPDPKYAIASLNGKYSGLNLLCIEYVGFKQIDPSVDLGFDLTQEYAAATAMHKGV